MLPSGFRNTCTVTSLGMSCARAVEATAIAKKCRKNMYFTAKEVLVMGYRIVYNRTHCPKCQDTSERED